MPFMIQITSWKLCGTRQTARVSKQQEKILTEEGKKEKIPDGITGIPNRKKLRGEGAYRKHSGKSGKGRNLCGWKQVMSLYFRG